MYVEQLVRLERLLASVTYRPGYHLSIQPAGMTHDLQGIPAHAEYILLVTCERPDASSREGKLLPIVGVTRLPLESLDHISNEIILRELFFNALVDFEIHEVKEWFKFEGHHVRDPHPK